MRALAGLVWGLALILAVLIMRDPAGAVPPPASVLEAPVLSLWRPAVAPVAARVQVPVAMASAAPVPLPSPPPVLTTAAACARLGLFPGTAWAGAAARLLSAPEAPAATALAWHQQPVAGRGYYVVFEGVTPAALAERIGQRRAALGRLVPRNLRPEACTK